MYYQNPPPHPGDDTAPDAPRISRRTTIVLGSLVGSVFAISLSNLTIFVFAPWLAGLLNIHPAIMVAAASLVLACAGLLIYRCCR